MNRKEAAFALAGLVCFYLGASLLDVTLSNICVTVGLMFIIIAAAISTRKH